VKPALPVSVVVPTFNRANLWRSSPLLESLRAQTCQNFELVIVDDGSSDDTTSVISDSLSKSFPGAKARLAIRLGPRPKPCPASGLPDMVGFNMASGRLIIHLDDDLRVSSRLVEHVLELDLSRAVLWLQFRFLEPDGTPIPGRTGIDVRKRFAGASKSIVDLPKALPVHYGAAFVVHSCDLRAIGGHCLEHAGWRNSDTRLGRRLVDSGLRSLLGVSRDLSVDHFGLTWFRLHYKDKPKVEASRFPAGTEPVVCNGGLAVWGSLRLASITKILGSWSM